MNSMPSNRLHEVFELLNARLVRNEAPPVGMVVCGGAALIALDLVSRTTADVDIVALADSTKALFAPAPLPDFLVQSAREVALTLHLPEDWLNNGPSRDEGGLFQMGLPDGIATRLHPRTYGDRLTVYFIDRVDQIHFKLYAAVDRGGYHISDLETLRPTSQELVAAARWAMTHDVSDGFRISIKRLLEALGYGTVAEKL